MFVIDNVIKLVRSGEAVCPLWGSSPVQLYFEWGVRKLKTTFSGAKNLLRIFMGIRRAIAIVTVCFNDSVSNHLQTFE